MDYMLGYTVTVQFNIFEGAAILRLDKRPNFFYITFTYVVICCTMCDVV